MAQRLKHSGWFPPANPGARGTRDAWSELFPPPGVSGVYALRSRTTHEVLYVGESHTDRLRETAARHLQIWNDPRQPRHTYDRARVEICWMETAPGDALDYEAEWIEDLDPRDNLAEPYDKGYPAGGDYDDSDLEYAGADDDEVPF